jgi:hypothetical protein
VPVLLVALVEPVEPVVTPVVSVKSIPPVPIGPDEVLALPPLPAELVDVVVSLEPQATTVVMTPARATSETIPRDERKAMDKDFPGEATVS